MDEAIKRKLVGAAVLVIIALIMLPQLMPTSRNTRYLSDSVPAMPEAPAMVMPTPKSLDIPVSELLAEGTPSGSTVTVASVQVDREKTPVETFQKPNKTVTGQASIWQIQVASFAEISNAIALRDRLRKDGFQAFEQLSDDGRHTRVFVGPSYQKIELEKQAQQIDEQHHLKTQIVPFQPR